MIQAHKAQRIMELYEQDYDNFLDGLKNKFKKKSKDAKQADKDAKAKNAEASQKKAEADTAGQNLKEAEQHKKAHLGQKAKQLLDKAGGIKGVADSLNKVMGFIKKEPVPSDYQVEVGDANKKESKKIMGMPAMVVYAGAGVLVLGGIYALSVYMKNNKAQTQRPAVAQTPPQQIA